MRRPDDDTADIDGNGGTAGLRFEIEGGRHEGLFVGHLRRSGSRTDTATLSLIKLRLFAHQVDEESLLVNGDIMP